MSEAACRKAPPPPSLNRDGGRLGDPRVGSVRNCRADARGRGPASAVTVLERRWPAWPVARDRGRMQHRYLAGLPFFNIVRSWLSTASISTRNRCRASVAMVSNCPARPRLSSS